MDSFLNTLAAVLIGQPEIEGLSEIYIFDMDAEKLLHSFNEDAYLKISRLQTLISHEHEVGVCPFFNRDGSGSVAVTSANDALCVAEDTVGRIAMLQRLIIEVVREMVPQECDHFDVNYFAHVDGSIRRIPRNFVPVIIRK
jgi:hypothetical protein